MKTLKIHHKIINKINVFFTTTIMELVSYTYGPLYVDGPPLHSANALVFVEIVFINVIFKDIK